MWILGVNGITAVFWDSYRSHAVFFYLMCRFNSSCYHPSPQAHPLALLARGWGIFLSGLVPEVEGED